MIKKSKNVCSGCGYRAFHIGRCNCATSICEYCSMFNMCKDCYLNKTSSATNYIFMGLMILSFIFLMPLVNASPYEQLELMNTQDYTNNTYGKYEKMCLGGACSMHLTFHNTGSNPVNVFKFNLLDTSGNMIYNRTNDTRQVWGMYMHDLRIYHKKWYSHPNGSTWYYWENTTIDDEPQFTVNSLAPGSSYEFIMQWFIPTDSHYKTYDVVPEINNEKLWDYALFTSVDIPRSDLVIYYPFDTQFNMDTVGGLVENKGAGNLNLQYTSGFNTAKHYINDSSSLKINGTNGHINLSDVDGTILSGNTTQTPRTWLRDDYTVTLFVNDSTTAPASTDRILAFNSGGGLAFNRRNNGSGFVEIDSGGQSVIWDSPPKFFNDTWVC